MNYSNLISLAGGLALFLYGMSVMGGGLEKLSGGKMERALEKLTSNVFKSVLLGAVVTGMIQSSSATTVIVVGLVNAKILKLKQAIGVILGANIGTTITAQIIRLSDIESTNIFLNLLKPKTLSPIIAVIGIVLYLFANKIKKKDMGQICLGFSVLFTGMFTMESAVAPLKDSPVFADILTSLSNPVLGIIAGAVVTAIIQSSSASIGILQAISSTGVLSFSAAFPIIMGQNIGTCITPIMASIGANKNAKRSAMIHLYFNIIGTIVFVAVFYTVVAFVDVPFWNDPIDRGGIANFHTFFNVVAALLFMPFTGLLQKLAEITIKDKDDEEEIETGVLDERLLVSPGLAIGQVHNSIETMSKYAQRNYKESIKLLNKFDNKSYERFKEYEDIIDKMEDRLSNYLLKLNEREINENESREVTELLHIISEFERIGDYSMNIAEQAQQLYEKNIAFSETAKEELKVISEAVEEIIEHAIDCFKAESPDSALQIEPLEETIDDMQATLKDRHIERLRGGNCSVDGGVAFLNILSHIERISDHCSNIGVYVTGYEEKYSNFDRHAFIDDMHKGKMESFNKTYRGYYEKYYSKIASVNEI